MSRAPVASQEYARTYPTTCPFLITCWADWLTLDAIKAQKPLLVTNMRRPYLVVLPYDAYLALVKKAQKAEA